MIRLKLLVLLAALLVRLVLWVRCLLPGVLQGSAQQVLLLVLLPLAALLVAAWRLAWSLPQLHHLLWVQPRMVCINGLKIQCGTL